MQMNEIISFGYIDQTETLISSGVAPVASDPRTSGAVELIRASLAGTGALTATIHVEYSSDLVSWAMLSEIALSDNEPEGGFAVSNDSPFVRAKLVSIAGTDANCIVTAITSKQVAFRVPLEYMITD
jgi:hypothetical protein